MTLNTGKFPRCNGIIQTFKTQIIEVSEVGLFVVETQNILR